MSGRSRTSFDKLQKERRRQEKQAAKRARRQGTATEQRPADPGAEPADPGEEKTGRE